MYFYGWIAQEKRALGESQNFTAGPHRRHFVFGRDVCGVARDSTY